jgi:hypothetical protein
MSMFNFVRRLFSGSQSAVSAVSAQSAATATVPPATVETKPLKMTMRTIHGQRHYQIKDSRGVVMVDLTDRPTVDYMERTFDNADILRAAADYRARVNARCENKGYPPKYWD